jgi:hypothetical protein
MFWGEIYVTGIQVLVEWGKRLNHAQNGPLVQTFLPKMGTFGQNGSIFLGHAEINERLS